MSEFVPPATQLAQEAAGSPGAPVPPTPEVRQLLASAVAEYVGQRRAVPPLTLEELSAATRRVLQATATEPRYHDYVAVLVNNEVWREHLAAIPYDRRLLLLPMCLRDAACAGRVDAFGLVCNHCGRCLIDQLSQEARKLGYVVLVAEGSPVVTSLIESGQVQAVVGVSCLSVLARVFPYMEAAAIPGLAIPLLRDGCADTGVDVSAVWEAIYCTSGDRTRGLDLDALRRTVDGWFAPAALENLLGEASGQTERIARAWLARSGKRWRPFLAVCAYQAFQPDPQAQSPDWVRRLALAVECFHKASLVHDDIEDNDAVRYGRPALHQEYGVPVALNVGDFLLGEGYRLLAELPAADSTRARMLGVAAEGHCQLSLGQGDELCWRRGVPARRALAPAEVLSIFRRKTAPAFDVALRLGALAAGAEAAVGPVLGQYSAALGVAYQIADDLADFGDGAGQDLRQDRPSFLMALAYEKAGPPQRALLEAVWTGRAGQADISQAGQVLAHLAAPGAREELARYRRQATDCLHGLTNANLKGLLRRVLTRIFDESPAMGCCREHQAGNARLGQPGRHASG